MAAALVVWPSAEPSTIGSAVESPSVYRLRICMAQRVLAGCAFSCAARGGTAAARAGAAGAAGAADTAGLTPSSTAAAHTTAKAAVVGRTRR